MIESMHLKIYIDPQILKNVYFHISVTSVTKPLIMQQLADEVSIYKT